MSRGLLREGGQTTPSLVASPVVIFTDARASESDACLGGYLATWTVT